MLDNVEVFLQVVRTGSLSAAARVLHMTTSNVSHRLHTLENELNCTLIRRTRGSKALQLTADGLQFLPLAERWENLRQEVARFRDFHGELSLTIGATDSVLSYVLHPLFVALNTLRATHHVRLFTVTSRYDELYRRLMRKEIDAAFVQMRAAEERVDLREVLREDMVIVQGHKTLAQAEEGPVSISAYRLEDEVYVDWSPMFRAWHQITFGEQESPFVRLDAVNSLQGFLRVSTTWAIVPVSMARALETAGFASRPIMEEVPQRRLYFAVRHHDGPKAPSLRLLEHCVDTVWPQAHATE